MGLWYKPIPSKMLRRYTLTIESRTLHLLAFGLQDIKVWVDYEGGISSYEQDINVIHFFISCLEVLIRQCLRMMLFQRLQCRLLQFHSILTG